MYNVKLRFWPVHLQLYDILEKSTPLFIISFLFFQN